MRNALITTVTVLVVLVGIDVALRADDTIPEPDDWASPYTHHQYEALQAIEDLELVVLGSSIGATDIAAERLIDGTAHNASLPSMGPSIWWPWYRDVVAAKQPDIVVIATDLRFFDGADPHQPRHLEEFLTSPGYLRATGGSTTSDITGDFWELYRLRSQLTEPDLIVDAMLGQEVDEWRPIRVGQYGQVQGFLTASHNPDPEWLASLERAWADAEWGGPQDEALRSIVGLAQSNGSEVVLVITPSMRSLLASALPNGEADIASYEEAIRSIGEDFDVPVLSYPEMDDKAFYYADYYHMNRTGSWAFSDRLAADLEDLFG